VNNLLSNQLSLETAKKLKEAGLQWEPRDGDWYYTETGKRECIPRVKYHKIYDRYIFAPRLDQLLAEIEKRGYAYNFIKIPNEKKSYCSIYGSNHLSGERFDGIGEEAAAQALLWILKRQENFKTA